MFSGFFEVSAVYFRGHLWLCVHYKMFSVWLQNLKIASWQIVTRVPTSSKSCSLACYLTSRILDIKWKSTEFLQILQKWTLWNCKKPGGNYTVYLKIKWPFLSASQSMLKLKPFSPLKFKYDNLYDFLCL